MWYFFRYAEISFTNHIPSKVKPVLLKFHEKDDTAGWHERDEIALPHGDGVILTSNGLQDALIKKNLFTSKIWVYQLSRYSCC